VVGVAVALMSWKTLTLGRVALQWSVKGLSQCIFYIVIVHTNMLFLFTAQDVLDMRGIADLINLLSCRPCRMWRALQPSTTQVHVHQAAH